MGGISSLEKSLVSTSAQVTPQAPALVDLRERVEVVPLAKIRPCAFQPRRDFAPESLHELAESIRSQGVLQPLLVRLVGDHYELIAGERRWRAAQLVGLKELPVLVRAADDGKVLELALIENLQRENLNPIEEAAGYGLLIQQFHLKQEEIATRVGKSRTSVTNALRLLQLPPSVQQQVRAGELSIGHAKVILSLDTAEAQAMVAGRVIRENLSVRQTEEVVAELQTSRTAAKTSASAKGSPDIHVKALQTRLQEHFGTKVSVRYRKGKGAVEIRFFSDDDLDRVLGLLGVQAD